MHQAINLILYFRQHKYGHAVSIWAQAWYCTIKSLRFTQEFNFANNEFGKWLAGTYIWFTIFNPLEVNEFFDYLITIIILKIPVRPSP